MMIAVLSRPRLRSILGLQIVAALVLLIPACSGGQLPRDGGLPPAAVCGLPFDPGTCLAAFPVYAFVNGACVPQTYGGCGGNANRFRTQEECMAVCEGRPLPNGCPAGRVAREICLECGPAGGCGAMATVCALACDAATACPNELRACVDGVCQTGGCF